MTKLVALERIYGLFSNITYAEKHDEVELIKYHDEQVGFYRNLRTSEPFHAKKERIGEVEIADIFLFVETEKKKQQTVREQNTAKIKNDNQADLFN